MRWIAVGALVVWCVSGGMIEGAHIAYRPLEVGLEGEDVYELQLTLGYFGQTLGEADGRLDSVTFQALQLLLQLPPELRRVGGPYLQELYWFYLAREWPRSTFIVPPQAAWDEVACAFGVTVQSLRLVNRGELVQGETCLIPVEYVGYRVMTGDTLEAVAAAHRVDAARLAYWNGLGTEVELLPGARLVVVMAERETWREEQCTMHVVEHQELVARLEQLAHEGRVSCRALLVLAEQLVVKPQRIGQVADELGLKIAACQLGCFR